MRREEIIAALTVLGARLDARGIDGDVYVRLLARELGLADADSVLAVAETVYGDRLDAAARFFVEELFAAER